MDTFVSDIDGSELDSDSEEEGSDCSLHGATPSVIHCVNENEIKEWLETNGYTEGATYSSKKLVIINQILQEAVRRNRLNVAKLVMKYGASVCIRDSERKTLLHLACDCLREEDTKDMVTMLLLKGCLVNAKDEDGNTPLHCAAENGHTMSIRILLNAGAKLNVKNDLDDTPVHAAAENGHLQVIEEMIESVPGCVNYRGFQQETPLHDACSSGCVEVVRRLLEKGADIEAVSEVGETPLHKAAQTSSVAVVKLLLDEGAEVNPRTEAKRSPLAKACYFGHTDVVNFLLGRGADVRPKALEDAIKEGYEMIAHSLLQNPQWPKAMRHTFTCEGKVTTPFRQLIRKMPGVAQCILNKCTLSPPNCPDPGDVHYSVLFNYEFVEDFQDENHDSDDESKPKRKRKFDEKQTYGCGYMDVRQSKTENFTTVWGPVGYCKDNHPLQVMVQHKRLNLLKHPLIGSLLHYKWKTFSRLVYFINLVSYALFVLFITAFAMIVPNPQSCICHKNAVTNVTCTNEVQCESNGDVQSYIYFTGVAVILFATCRLLLEFIQLCLLRFRFIFNWGNVMEIILFLFSVVYAWVFNSPCLCPKHWQWQIGAIAVFLAWIDLILFFAKFPRIGIYSLIFVKIFSTFFKAVFVSALLVIAFALALYMSFYEPSIMRSPFSSPARALLKTISMTTGEQEFDSIFHQEASGGRDLHEEIPFPAVSFFVWILFIVFIPILLTNMLVGLAVGDIQNIYDEASLKRLSLQVEQVLTFEELLPTKLRRRFVTGFKEVFPNQRPTIRKRLQYVFWDGQPYDTKHNINTALRPSLDPNKDLKRKTDLLSQDVEEIRHSLTHIEGHTKQTRQDLNIIVRDTNGIKPLIQEHNSRHVSLLSDIADVQQSLKRTQVAILQLSITIKEILPQKFGEQDS